MKLWKSILRRIGYIVLGYVILGILALAAWLWSYRYDSCREKFSDLYCFTQR